MKLYTASILSEGKYQEIRKGKKNKRQSKFKNQVNNLLNNINVVLIKENKINHSDINKKCHN